MSNEIPTALLIEVEIDDGDFAVDIRKAVPGLRIRTGGTKSKGRRILNYKDPSLTYDRIGSHGRNSAEAGR